MSEKTLGQVAYDAYDGTATAWDSIAAAVEAEVLRREQSARLRELVAMDEHEPDPPLASTPAERRRLAIHAGAMALIAAQTERKREMIEGKAFIRYESPSYEAAADMSEGQMLEIERREKERQ